jgi:AcrR family transcriptional regulator
MPMPAAHLTRLEQRAASEAAILDAAVECYATSGPDGVSLREVARSAGLTHALVARYFGSKQGLVAAVEERLSTELTAVMSGAELTHAASLAELLARAHEHPTSSKLIIRSGLGDLDRRIVPAVIAQRCPAATDGDRRTRLRRYGAASLLLGWLSWDRYFALALQLDDVSRHVQNDAMAAAASVLGLGLELGTQPEPTLEPRPLHTGAETPPAPAPRSARDALLSAAVELFAEHGPASVSIRDVARHAGVNHGLVHRHFGTKDDLLAEAIEAGSLSLLPGTFAPEGFDIDAVVYALHHGSPSPKTIARALVDDIDVENVRRHYPVLRGLLALVGQLGADARPAALTDPRLAAAAAGSLVIGSAIWATPLRDTFGLADDDGVESAVADLGRWLIGAPTAPTAKAAMPDE